MRARRRRSWRSRTRSAWRSARGTAMTTDALVSDRAAPIAASAELRGRVLPLATVLLIIAALWYAAAVGLNAQRVRDQLNQTGQPWTTADLITGTWSMERPVLPTPDQVLREFWKTTVETPITNK